MRFWDRWLRWIDTSETLVARWIRAARDALFGEMPVLAGGTALFTILAIVPTFAAIVAVYGVVADPSEIGSHLRSLHTVLPDNVVVFVTDQLEQQAERSNSDLSFALIVSIVVAVWAARGAASAMIDALNQVYRVRERRGTIQRLLIAIAMGASTLIGLMVMFSVVVGLPSLFKMLGLDGWHLVRWVRWPVLMTLVFVSLLLLYRFAPSPRPLAKGIRFLWPGSLLATLLLVGMSSGLGFWVEQVSDYNVWYGTFGSVVVVMLWFYLSTIAVLVGGFVNAELERAAGAPEPEPQPY